MAAERRDHHRTRCRLGCAITLGRTRIRGRVLDVSEGGLCVLVPQHFARDAKLQLTIHVPHLGPIDLEATVWHQRRIRQAGSGKKGWATGLILDKAGPSYQSLVDPRSSQPESLPEIRGIRGGPEPEVEVAAEEELAIYRLRVKAMGSMRTKVLTLSASSADVAREAALKELPGEWTVLDITLR